MNELRTLSQDIVASLVLKGDLKGLTPSQKVEYYNYRCAQAGLDPAAKPFDLLVLNGKEILYANASATQQLTANRGLSHEITGRDLTDGIYCVFCRVKDLDGRSTENMGATPVEGLKGEAKANAMLKATTKAIRRSVLAHCGLGLMDETEVETIHGAMKSQMPTTEDRMPEEDFQRYMDAIMDAKTIGELQAVYTAAYRSATDKDTQKALMLAKDVRKTALNDTTFMTHEVEL